MELAKLSSKGQITVPKHIRDVLDVKEGEHVAFVEEGGIVFMAKADLDSIHDLQEILSDSKFKEVVRKAKQLK
ncbi:AbrB/MazE/SpoVT family DNA-binding domain-containing protein [Terribacillus sp. 179-K 1B1 HS]|uniref:Looped-hinge helix DNA binding domain-containing protein, AbrB family n=1 Tax=Terribacillus halophilus TaxID=361279 RepID=A0A1G6QWU8_9BACI|nr:AbrB/MazE/SpoVT family DNA-binding domain-containing protein [Terribacillus halophilus]SDC96255.1 looped-hinge helix DNA binding domain-containing protein, AbrB family [Terribacillus halophilus]